MVSVMYLPGSLDENSRMSKAKLLVPKNIKTKTVITYLLLKILISNASFINERKQYSKTKIIKYVSTHIQVRNSTKKYFTRLSVCVFLS